MKTKLASSPFLILTLAFSTRVFLPVALAQSPVPDDFNPGDADLGGENRPRLRLGFAAVSPPKPDNYE
jgi:hypothetical protein